MKSIIASGHGFDRSQERSITRIQIETAIKTPDLKRAARHGKVEVIKGFDGRKLHVFYKETVKSIIFITAYWKS